MRLDLDSTCVVNMLLKRKEWIFQDCFLDKLEKESLSFWEKEWESINKISYYEKIVSLIYN